MSGTAPRRTWRTGSRSSRPSAGGGCPASTTPRFGAWLQLAGIAATVLAWLRLLALDGDLALAEPKALRFRLLAVPARYVTHARTRALHVPTSWPWAADLVTAWARINNLTPG